MRPGSIVGFKDKKDLTFAWVSALEKDKVRLIVEKGKEFAFPGDKVLVETTRRVDPPAAREDVVSALVLTREAVAQIASEIVIADLWELLQDSVDGLDLATLTSEYLGAHTSGDQRAAMLTVLLADTIYFKQKGEAYVPRSPEQVQEILHQRQADLRRSQERALAVVWLSGLMNGPLPSVVEAAPPGAQRFLDQVRTWVVDQEAQPPEFTQFLRDCGVADLADGQELLARAGIWSPDENVLIHRHRVPLSFSREALAYEDQLAQDNVDPARILAQAGRVDMTALATYSVDDEVTQDIDDALSIEAVPGAGWRIGIHIADVGEFVRDSDPLDREAIRRGTTIYLPDQRIQMLPDRTTHDLGSLVEGVVHPTVSVMVTVTDSAEIKDVQLIRGAIKVRRRLSYDIVDRDLENGTEPYVEGFKTLLDLARQLRNRRIDAGALVFNVPDVKIVIGADGVPSVEQGASDTPSHLLVSELMILANGLVAQWLRDQGVPAIYRVQVPPDEPIALRGYDPVQFYRMRRFIRRTEPSSKPGPHAGLGLPVYVQMTSPIRRYTDLVIHRQIRGVLGGTGPAYTAEDIGTIMAQTERCHEIAGMVQKSAQRYWLLKYLATTVGEPTLARVLDVRDNDYVVQLANTLLEVPMARKLEKRYEEGQTLTVTVTQADPRRGVVKVRDVAPTPSEEVIAATPQASPDESQPA